MAIKKPTMRPRIVLIEDDAEREAKFRAWLEGSEFHLLVARHGGQALGMLEREDPASIAGMCLDHDLGHERANGAAVVVRLHTWLPRHVPILVHSMNPGGARWMETSLQAAGYTVKRTPYAQLTTADFKRWLGSVRDELG